MRAAVHAAGLQDVWECVLPHARCIAPWVRPRHCRVAWWSSRAIPPGQAAVTMVEFDTVLGPVLIRRLKRRPQRLQRRLDIASHTHQVLRLLCSSTTAF